MCAKRTLEQQEGSVQLRSRLGTTRDMGGKPSILPGCCAFKTFPQLFYRLYQLACKGFHTSCLRGPHGSNDLSPSFGRGPSLHHEPLHVGMIEDLGAAESRHPTRLAVRKASSGMCVQGIQMHFGSSSGQAGCHRRQNCEAAGLPLASLS